VQQRRNLIGFLRLWEGYIILVEDSYAGIREFTMAG
jgi:hypothetical protein